jgi:hypothetical protein
MRLTKRIKIIGHLSAHRINQRNKLKERENASKCEENRSDKFSHEKPKRNQEEDA